jgi:hypothetical protein
MGLNCTSDNVLNLFILAFPGLNDCNSFAGTYKVCYFKKSIK